MKEAIKGMLNPHPDQRPTAEELLRDFLKSEQDIEMEGLRKENEFLKKKLGAMEEYLQSHGFSLDDVYE